MLQKNPTILLVCNPARLIINLILVFVGITISQGLLSQKNPAKNGGIFGFVFSIKKWRDSRSFGRKKNTEWRFPFPTKIPDKIFY